MTLTLNFENPHSYFKGVSNIFDINQRAYKNRQAANTTDPV